jgi:hypothetical protein
MSKGKNKENPNTSFPNVHGEHFTPAGDPSSSRQPVSSTNNDSIYNTTKNSPNNMRHSWASLFKVRDLRETLQSNTFVMINKRMFYTANVNAVAFDFQFTTFTKEEAYRFLLDKFADSLIGLAAARKQSKVIKACFQSQEKALQHLEPLESPKGLVYAHPTFEQRHLEIHIHGFPILENENNLRELISIPFTSCGAPIMQVLFHYFAGTKVKMNSATILLDISQSEEISALNLPHEFLVKDYLVQCQWASAPAWCTSCHLEGHTTRNCKQLRKHIHPAQSQSLSSREVNNISPELTSLKPKVSPLSTTFTFTSPLSKSESMAKSSTFTQLSNVVTKK